MTDREPRRSFLRPAGRCGRERRAPHSGHARQAARTEDPVKLDKQELVRMLRTEGDNDAADRVESQLPDEIDTNAHGDALDAVGLNRTELMNKLAGGSFGTTLSP
jgi:hypothetical protein